MIECNLFFSKENQFRPHMLQALSGFISLNRQNAISLKIYYNSKPPAYTMLRVISGQKNKTFRKKLEAVDHTVSKTE